MDGEQKENALVINHLVRNGNFVLKSMAGADSELPKGMDRHTGAE